jgi:hypothetical protein
MNDKKEIRYIIKDWHKDTVYSTNDRWTTFYPEFVLYLDKEYATQIAQDLARNHNLTLKIEEIDINFTEEKLAKEKENNKQKDKTFHKLYLILTLSSQLSTWIKSFKEDVKGKTHDRNLYNRLISIENNIDNGIFKHLPKDFDLEANEDMSVGVYQLLEMFINQDTDNLATLMDISKWMYDEQITHENIFVITDKKHIEYTKKLLGYE